MVPTLNVTPNYFVHFLSFVIFENYYFFHELIVINPIQSKMKIVS